ncbi:hypothetical protein [uncultured Gordonia sp.]|jgi:hypothetical protein|uniref:hypothetical protein n=1 Tax=uncultured Gordonia sp. TaxID=198437 RepID=UPI0026211E0F|nr:hypothetical protein [uncultured Gordonia sp.]
MNESEETTVPTNTAPPMKHLIAGQVLASIAGIIATALVQKGYTKFVVDRDPNAPIEVTATEA